MEQVQIAGEELADARVVARPRDFGAADRQAVDLVGAHPGYLIDPDRPGPVQVGFSGGRDKTLPKRWTTTASPGVNS